MTRRGEPSNPSAIDDAGSRSDPSVTRLARVLGGIAGMASLAGCGLSFEGDDRDGDRGPTADDRGSIVGTDGDTGDPSDSPRETFGLTAEECERELADLAAEIESTTDRRERVTAEVADLREAIERLDIEREVLESKPASLLADAGTVGEHARRAVVFLELDSGSATGWFIDDRYIMTNAHNVIDDSTGEIRDAPTIWTIEGERHSSTVVDYEPALAPDIALLESEAPAPASLDLAEETVSTDDPIVQVGHPGGVGNWVISTGVVRGRWQVQSAAGHFTEILSDVPGTEGVSGSPVMNLDGEVVGMTAGGSPLHDRLPGERPVSHPAILYDRHLAVRVEAIHVALEEITERYDGWT